MITITISITDKPVHEFGSKTMAVNLMTMLIFVLTFIFAFLMILSFLEPSTMYFVIYILRSNVSRYFQDN